MAARRAVAGQARWGTGTGRSAARLALTGALAVALAAVPLALLVRAGWAPLVDADMAVTRAAERAVHASALLLHTARLATLLGDPTATWLLVTAAAAVLAARRAWRLAAFLLLSRAGAQLLSSALKAAVDRARPVFDLPVDTARGPSFPSGHTVAAAATWTALAVLVLLLVRPHRRWPVLAAALLVAAAVAASRVLLGVHYLSDVVGGLLLGAGWVALCVALLLRPQPDGAGPGRDPVGTGH